MRSTALGDYHYSVLDDHDMRRNIHNIRLIIGGCE